MNNDTPHILVCHTAAVWIGLVKVLCYNKVPKISQAFKFQNQDGTERLSTVKKKEVTRTGQQPAANMVMKEAVPSPRGHSLMKGQNSQTESGSDRKLHRSKDINGEHQPNN